jgi:uncharacterized protein (TIGR02246 family)
MKILSTNSELHKTCQKLVEDFDRAWNERDPEALASLFNEDADFQFHNGLLVRSRNRIRRFYFEKVFPTLPEGMKHISHSVRVRFVTEGVLIGDGKVDLVDESKSDPDKKVQQRLKVTTVLVKKEDMWRFSAVRVMVPAKD